MKTVIVSITARPSYNRVYSILKHIRGKVRLVIILHSSSIVEKYGNIENILIRDGFNVDYKIYNLIETNSKVFQPKSTAMALNELPNIILREKPSLFITIADRFETIANAICASYMNIPLLHIQGGEITGNIDDKVRNSVSQLSDLHLVSTKKSAERLKRMFIPENNIFNIGCPSLDLVTESLNKKQDLNAINEYKGIGKLPNLEKKFLLILFHPDTKEGEKNNSYISSIFKAVIEIGLPAIWLWPNIDAGNHYLTKFLRQKINNEASSCKNIFFVKNFAPDHFIYILSKSFCLLGNSSLGIRECSYLGIPSVNIGNRQQLRERSLNVIDCFNDSDDIVSSFYKITETKRYPSSSLYGNGNAGMLGAEVILNFLDEA